MYVKDLIVRTVIVPEGTEIVRTVLCLIVPEAVGCALDLRPL